MKDGSTDCYTNDSAIEIEQSVTFSFVDFIPVSRDVCALTIISPLYI